MKTHGFPLTACGNDGLDAARFSINANLPRSGCLNLEKFKLIARTLLAGEPLDPLHRDHRLIGNFQGRRECHIEADWLLIYKVEETRIIFERMGTHSDLFNK